MAESELILDLTPPALIRVLMPNGNVQEMKLETYLAGAVAAEIGEQAPLEALKAQAVACRTYVVAAERHHDQHAHVCTTSHCQKWKHVDPVSSPEVFRALGETWGMVAVYNGELINTFFFEHCDGHTRSAEQMLIAPADYLQGVACACGHLTLKGHGIGMCKRGAIVMARRGAAFSQILRHYYRGIDVGRMQMEIQAPPPLEEPLPPRAPEPSKKPRTRKPSLIKKPATKPVPIDKPESIQSIPPTPIPVETKTEPPLTPVEKIEPRIEPAPILVETKIDTPITPVEKIEHQVMSQPSVIEPTEAKIETPIKPTEKIEPEIADKPRIEPAPIKSESPTPIVEPQYKIEPRTEQPAKVEPRPAQEPQPTTEKFVVVPKAVTRKPAPIIPPAFDSAPVKQEEKLIVVVRTERAQSPSEPITSSVTQTPSEPARTEEISAPVIAERNLPPLEGVAIKPIRRLHVDYLPGARIIAGSLPRAGIAVVIENGSGKPTRVTSGTAPHYGEGGFETPVDQDGIYHVSIEGQIIEIKMQGETAFIQAI